MSVFYLIRFEFVNILVFFLFSKKCNDHEQKKLEELTREIRLGSWCFYVLCFCCCDPSFRFRLIAINFFVPKIQKFIHEQDGGTKRTNFTQIHPTSLSNISEQTPKKLKHPLEKLFTNTQN